MRLVLRERAPDTRRTPQRIVSLLPSGTEIVCALGASDRLVGISHECDFPETVRGLPTLTRPKTLLTGSSRAIDTEVREALQARPADPQQESATEPRSAFSFYAIDADLLNRLEPDLIITQDLCEVCAVSLDDVTSAVSRLTGRDSVEILCLSPLRLCHVLEDIERVGERLGGSETGRAVRAELETRVHAIAARAARAASQRGARPKVVSVEWIDPLMLGGTWMPELIELAGGTALGVEVGEPAPTLTPDALAALAPDVVVLKPCGFTLERTLSERPVLENAIVQRVRNGTRVYAADGNAFFNRPGPRLIESIEILAACIHPESFPDFVRKHALSVERLA